MIKIRLHGEPSEIETAINVIKKNFEILSTSGMYADRGASKYSRVYLECKMLSLDDYLERNPGAFVQGGGLD